MDRPDDFASILKPPRGSPAPLGTEERVLIRMRPSARRLVWSAIALVAVCGGAGFAAVNLPEWSTVFVLAAALIVLVTVVLPILAWSARRIIVTTRRVLLRSGLFVRTSDEILLARCTGIVIRRSWIQAAARCADIHLRAFGGDAGVIIDAPFPRQTADVLRDLIEQQRIAPPAPPLG